MKFEILQGEYVKYVVYADGSYWQARDLLQLDGGTGIFGPTLYPFAETMWGAKRLIKRMAKNRERLIADPTLANKIVLTVEA